MKQSSKPKQATRKKTTYKILGELKDFADERSKHENSQISEFLECQSNQHGSKQKTFGREFSELDQLD